MPLQFAACRKLREFRELLLDFNWIEARLQAGGRRLRSSRNGWMRIIRHRSGVKAKLEAAGYSVAWAWDTRLADLELKGWEVVVDPDKQGAVLLWDLQAQPNEQAVTRALVTYTNPPPVFSRDGKLMAAMSGTN